MSFMTYFAIGLLFAVLMTNMKKVKAAMPDLYKTYCKETADGGYEQMKESTFTKAMVIGLMVIYGTLWPILLIRVIYKLIKGGDDNNNTPKTA